MERYSRKRSKTMKESGPTDTPPLKELVIHSDLLSARGPEDEIMEEVQACGYCEDHVFAIKLALEEALTNAVKHGNLNDPQKRVRIRYCVDREQAVIHVADEGGGFDPTVIPDPTLPERISLPNGRGIMLMRAYMDDVSYNSAGNEVRMVKWNQ